MTTKEVKEKAQTVIVTAQDEVNRLAERAKMAQAAYMQLDQEQVDRIV
jgi:acetaldehyde dehydrogenase/alcohol dehydrogenase